MQLGHVAQAEGLFRRRLTGPNSVQQLKTEEFAQAE